MDKVFKYYAFISYKHEDEKWAKWLQKRLETYRLPVALQKQNCPKHIKPVFRDNTDITPGKLEEKLHESLELSNYLIVICSKNLARESHYVDYEMQTFIDLGRSDKIIPFIVDGEPNAANPNEECFSELIKSFPGELLAANVKKDGKRTAALKVIASILKLNADDLIKRDKKRKKTQHFAGVVLAIIAMIFLSTTLNLRAQNYEKEAINSNLYSDYTSAIKYAVKSLKVPFNKDDSGEAAQILRSHVIADELKKTNNQFHKDYEIKAKSKSLALFVESADGTKVGFTDFSRVFVYDSATGEFLREFHKQDEIDEFKKYMGIDIDDELHITTNSNYELNKEPVKHKEKKEQSGEYFWLYLYDENDKYEHLYFLHNSAKRIYNESEDFIAVLRNGASYISVYSFENKKEFNLEFPESVSKVTNMYFSPKGRYLFVDFYSTLCVYDLEIREIVFECTKDEDCYDLWIFSKSDNLESLYIFSSYKIEKYAYTDKTPDLKDNILLSLTDDQVICEKNFNVVGIHLSDDGTKAVMTHNLHREPENKRLYTFFETHTGKRLMSFTFNDGGSEIMDTTPDIKYTIVYLNGKIYIYEIETATEICEIDCGNEEIRSAAISKNGNHAAFVDDQGVLTILIKKDGVYKSHSINVDIVDYGEKEILFINDKECVVNCGFTVLSCNIETGEQKIIVDDVGAFQDALPYLCRFDVFKSTRDFNNGTMLDTGYAGVFSFYSMKGGFVNTSGDMYLTPSTYYPEKNLLVGTEYTNQEMYNSEIVAVEYEGDTHNILYRYSSSIEVTNVTMDNNGKYIIINGPEGCEVLDALTGNLLFTLDRNIIIHDDVVYDISGDLVLPDALPHAEICSINQFISKGEDIIK